MGAWETGIYDNDIALDFMGKVAEEMSEKAESNEEILAIADMMSKYTYPSPLNTAIFIETIKEELDNLECWKEECRESRKQVLLDLLSKSTKPYININEDTIIYPYGLNEDKFKVQIFSKNDSMKEDCISIDYVMHNYKPIWDYRFKVTEKGLNKKEVDDFFEGLETIYGKDR